MQKQGKEILISDSSFIDIKKYIPVYKYKLILKLGKLADEYGVNAYLVGGVVRDLFIYKTIKTADIDITIEGNGTEFTKFLADRLNAQYKCFEKFKTGKIFLKDKYNIDITSARTELYKYPAALPDVKYIDLKYDLYRRDFTINAMAIQINKNKLGAFIDTFNGYNDLRNKIIRILHNKSFIDDPTRILRAIRFENRFNFKIESSTLKKLKNALKKDIFHCVPGERLTDEFLLVFKEGKSYEILKRMQKIGILKKINKKIFIKKETKILLDKLRDLLKIPIFKEIDKNCIYFLIFMQSLDLLHTKELIKRLKLKNDWKNIIIQTKINQKKVLKKIKNSEIKKSDIYLLFKNFKKETIFYFALKDKKGIILENIKKYFLILKNIKLCITGNDLKKAGIKPGPVYKRILNKSLQKKIDGEIKNKQQEINFIKKYLKGGI